MRCTNASTLAFMLCLLGLSVVAGWVSEGQAYVRHARVEDLEVLRTDPATVRTQDGQWQRTRNDANWSGFTASYGSDWRVRWNELTGTPHRVFGGTLPAQALDARLTGAALQRDDILRLSEIFVRQQSRLLGVQWDDLVPVYSEFRGGRWVVTLKQTVAGVEVLGGRVDLRFSGAGDLMLFGADIYPVSPEKARPRLSAQRAWQSATRALPQVLGEARDAQADLVYLPMLADEPRDMGQRLPVDRVSVTPADLRVRAAYRVRVRTADPAGDWETYVDAATGTILWRENKVRFLVSGNVSGDVRELLGTDPPVDVGFRDQSVFGGALVDTVASYDFESGAAGWTAQPPWSLSSESTNSGTSAWSDSPGGNYGNGLNLLLTSPSLDISAIDDPLLSFFVRLQLEDTWDFLYVEASDDNGATWQIVDVLNDNGAPWQEVRVDLAPVEGTSQLRVRFRLFTDAFVVDDGVWIDDVTIASLGSDVTTSTGDYSLQQTGGDDTVLAHMVGRFTRVSNRAGADAEVSGVATSDTLDLIWSDSNSSSAERDVYVALNRVHARMKSIEPGWSDIDYPLPVFVGIPFCNAYWAGSQIVMGAGSAGCANLANWMPVMYHEYGHGVTDFIYDVVSDPPSSMHEAFSDYIASTITDDPRVGPDILGPGTMFRNCENKLRVPEDLGGQVHHDGVILAGALWDMRRNLMPDVALSDSLFHFARYGFPTSFEDYFLELLTVDDDDANLGNGTPHIVPIQSAFGEHGIGLGPEFQHAGVAVQDASGNADGRLDPGETAGLQLSLRNYGTAQNSVSVKLVPTTTGVTVLQDSIFIGAVAADAIETASELFTVSVADTVPVGTALNFDILVTSDDGYNGDCFMLPAGYAPILLVDDDRTRVLNTWFEDSLDRLGKRWTRWEAGTLGSPPAAVMATYRAVIWFTGNDVSTTINAGDQEELISYLGGGGNLFVTGEDIGADLWVGVNGTPSQADIDFYEDWLRAQVDMEDENGPPITGEASDLIGDGLSFSLNGGTSANNQGSASSLLPQGGAVVSLRYSSGRVAALRYDVGYRLFHCGFGFEGITTQADRDTLMSRALAWLCPAEANVPTVTVGSPNGGEMLTGNQQTVIEWTASDDIAVLSVDILLSLDNGANYDTVAVGVPNSFSYTWTIVDVTSSECLIRIEATDPSSNVGFDVSDATFTITSTTDAASTPRRFALHPAAPNPFNPMTTLSFDLPRVERVWLEILSVDGRRVRTLVRGEPLQAGSLRRVWNGRDDAGRLVASGVYIVRLRAGAFTQTRKVQLLK